VFLNGTLRASAGSSGGAGIGCGSVYSPTTTVSELAILGGNISASGSDGAGIGSGHADSGTSTVSELSILGGNITASGSNGAGIGSGYTERPGDQTTQGGVSSVLRLMISGGNISGNGTAGAGIGSGCAVTGTSSVISLEISGGNVSAVGSEAAGIGSGIAYDDGFGISAGTSTVVNCTICGGHIHAAGSRGAGIGSGWSSQATRLDVSTVSNLVISGGVIDARAFQSAAIGSGAVDDGDSEVDNCSILGGDVTATGTYGAGIGSGASIARRNTDRTGYSVVSRCVIAGGNITASGSYGAGIGSGYANGDGGIEFAYPKSEVGDLTISGGNITASGSNGAAVGSGYAYTDRASSSVTRLLISGGFIRANASGGAGIGAGSASGGESSVREIVVVNGSLIVRTARGYPGIGNSPFALSRDDKVTVFGGFFDCGALDMPSCFNSTALTFQDGAATAITNFRIVGASSQARMSGAAALYFEYIASSSQEAVTGLPMLHIGSISLPYPTVYTLTVRQEHSNGVGFARELLFDSSRFRGCAFTVPAVAEYTILFDSASPVSSGQLRHDGSLLFNAADLYDNYYASAESLLFPTRSPLPTPRPSQTPTSTETPPRTPCETRTPLPSEAMTATSSPAKTVTAAKEVTATATRAMTASNDPQDSGGDGTRIAVIVVPIVVVALGLLAIIGVCWYRRRRKLDETLYQSLTDPVSPFGAGSPRQDV
jgi:hypothetical protein